MNANQWGRRHGHAKQMTAAVMLLAVAMTLHAQPPGPPPGGPGGPGGPPGFGGPPGPPADARTQQPFDLTGYWESVVTQDWRLRMVLPGPGEYSNIEINQAAKTFADAWDRAADEAAGKQCEAYGAGIIMRVPEHLRVQWRDANTLVVDTDAGQQTRVFYFRPSTDAAAAPPSWQGYSQAKWDLDMPPSPLGLGGPRPAGPPSGELEVNTTHMLAGLLRKNGLPYSDHAKLTEYWDINPQPNVRWLTVTSELDDAQYLSSPFVYNSIFRAQPDGSKWDPQPCTLDQ
jgi:hypothetical protein